MKDITLQLLLVLFIGLKLTGYIDWSWWWVLSPVLIPIALVILYMAYDIFQTYRMNKWLEEEDE
jgi:cell division protein FtsW (lipid II flippase)